MLPKLFDHLREGEATVLELTELSEIEACDLLSAKVVAKALAVDAAAAVT